MAKSYHHGNLREALINAGLKIINEQGEDNLSLRKVAAACNVSHAAPYAHFKDKEELLESIKKDVTRKFTEELIKSIEGVGSTSKALIAVGKAYISFFSRNPDYYAFLFGRQNIVAHLQISQFHKEDYPPFLLLRKIYKKHLKDNHIKKSAEEQEIGIIKIWAIIHGLASIACMNGVETSFDWENIDIRLLT